MRNLLIFLKFKGTNYLGFQVQKNQPTITMVVQDALEKLTKERPDIKGCSRTDAGVHANMYCINFKTDTDIPDEKMAYVLNNLLPKDVVCYRCILVKNDFHARYYCQKKEYIYLIKDGGYENPIIGDLVYHFPYALDIKKMKEASKEFVGTHNFLAFSGNKEDLTGGGIKTIEKCEVFRENGLICIIVKGDSFLMHMVRIIVGTIIDIGNNKILAKDIESIMLSKERKRAGSTAPAHGLYLNKVFYKEDYSL